MNDEDSGSGRKGISRQRPPPPDDPSKIVGTELAYSENSDFRLETIDWEKIRSTIYEITSQVSTVKPTEERIRKQLKAMSNPEWVGIPDTQELALGMAHSLAAQWLIENLDWEPLQIYMYRLTSRLAAVDEITQVMRDKLVRMRAEVWSPIADRSQYIKQMVFYAAADWRERENSQQYGATTRLKSEPALDHDGGDIASRACASRDVLKLLRKLSRRVRQAFVLHRGWGYSVKETSAHMKVSEKTVKGYLKDAAREFSKLEDHQNNLCRARRRSRPEDKQ
jgi:DNA-directed RNA polymerase specialized sigma24 family protein